MKKFKLLFTSYSELIRSRSQIINQIQQIPKCIKILLFSISISFKIIIPFTECLTVYINEYKKEFKLDWTESYDTEMAGEHLLLYL